jgi:PAS domain S-box-containing protein
VGLDRVVGDGVRRRELGVRVLGICVLGIRLLGVRVLGIRLLGIRLLGERVLGIRVLGVRVLGIRLLGQRVRRTMSAVAGTPRAPRGLPLAPGAAFLWLAVVGGAAAGGAFAAGSHGSHTDWIGFVLLSGAAATAQLFVVRTGINQAFHTALAFVTAGALLLPPELVVLMALVQHLPEWRKERYPPYIQIFNIGNFALDGLLGWGVAHGLRSSLPGSSEFRWALAGVAAGAAIIAANHLVLALMLWLARGHTLRDSELFSTLTLGPDLLLAMGGVTLALAWHANPWLVPAVVAPLFGAQRLFRAMGLLRESEQRFRAMFESAPFGAELTDLEGNIVSVNAALERMLGYSQAELLALPRERYADAESDRVDRELLDELAHGGRSRYEIDRRFTNADGGEVLAHVAVSLVPDADGRPKYRLALVEDVTRRAELEEQLRQSQRLEAVGRLAGGIAHDFNNLLTAIGGYAEIVLARGDAVPETTADIEEILKASRRAASLTAQLLAFSRKQVLQPKRVNLNALVNDTHRLLRRLIGENIELATAFSGPDVPDVNADPGQLEQVVVNLVVNARDAIRGDGRVTVETRSVEIDDGSPLLAHEGAAAGPYAVLTVRDTGDGIAAADLPRLFDPFFTTKAVGAGTGLGLATVYGIVRQSGGFLTVTTAPGAGAAFSVHLPRLPDEAAGRVHEEQPAPAMAGSECVLLVEDEPSVRHLLTRMLAAHGYDVIAAEHGAEAVERAASIDRIDILVTDVVMPEMNGREVAHRLRESNPQLRVLYTSGYTEVAIAEETASDEHSDFLLKPFGAAQLTEKIRSLVDAT